MIELYYWTTPNGHKITIFLEEVGLPYKIIPINIGAGDQFKPEYLQIAPNNKIPAIIDLAPEEGGAPIEIFESGAILLYLADKTKQFIPQNLRGRTEVIQWLFWQMSGLGPMMGQNAHFSTYATEKIPYAINRYRNETSRLFAVLDKQLTKHSYIAGEYSIADMACYPWIARFEALQQNMDEFEHLKRWFFAVQSRPAVVRAYEKANQINPQPTMTEDAKRILFGQNADTIKRS
ncbi:MAG: thiol:disulfide oxidoreductase [Gammaproteobacteria bacterium 39-13]|nr:glutathione S-transferase N-terminal domain-containing protein [Gammaproteobacteria bacterium]OJV96668.1 MAG: thiol:disulfide oxidoreductase [Gammaproteobacteria bacterium 39-13]